MDRALVALFARLIFLACAFIPVSTISAAEALSAKDFGRLPAIGDVALSPDGNRVAWIDNYSAQPFVTIFNLATGKEQGRTLPPEGMKLRSLEWSDEQTLLIFVSMLYSPTGKDRDQFEWSRTLALDVTTGKSRNLLHENGDTVYVTGSTIVALRTGKPDTIVMSSLEYSESGQRQDTGNLIEGGRKGAGWVSSVFEVNTRTGKGSLLHRGSAFTNRWIANEKGEVVARSEWEAARGIYRVLYRNDDNWREIHRQDDGEDPRLIGMTRDGDALLVAGKMGRQRHAVWQIPLDGSAAQIVLEHPEQDIVGTVFDPYSRQPVGAWVANPVSEVLWLDPQAQARWTSVKKAFAGMSSVTISGRSADYSRVLAAVESHSKPEVYYLVDFKKGTAEIVGEDYPSLAGKALGDVRELSYKARDGVEIPAFLTLPPGVDAKQLPMIVLPHGGPESRDTRTFDWVAQFLATRGYAVLQPQFRGSTGYGEAFRLAGYRQWGGLMQDDVTDGVRAMIEQGIADARRVCIAGLSYGGYAALAGAAFTPDTYACAASVNGVSDLTQMLTYVSNRSGRDSDSTSYWKDHIGTVGDANVEAKSPARAAANIRIPVLLIHGVGDTVVPVTQSRGMATALKQQKKAHTLIELPGEDHWLSEGTSRIRVLEELDSFFANSLAPGAANPGSQVATEEAPNTECRREARTGSIRRREVCRERNNKTSDMRDEVNEMGRKTIPNQNGF